MLETLLKRHIYFLENSVWIRKKSLPDRFMENISNNSKHTTNYKLPTSNLELIIKEEFTKIALTLNINAVVNILNH